jgi:invasion protein IalB
VNISENSALKISARIMLDFIKLSLVMALALIFAYPGKSAQAKEKKSTATPPTTSAKEENYWSACMKKRNDKKKCDLLVELRQNLEDAKKLPAPVQ